MRLAPLLLWLAAVNGSAAQAVPAEEKAIAGPAQPQDEVARFLGSVWKLAGPNRLRTLLDFYDQAPTLKPLTNPRTLVFRPSAEQAKRTGIASVEYGTYAVDGTLLILPKATCVRFDRMLQRSGLRPLPETAPPSLVQHGPTPEGVTWYYKASGRIAGAEAEAFATNLTMPCLAGLRIGRPEPARKSD
ncbi:hypothetical protein [Thermomonas fusca]|jgi:hypothetical protein